MRSDKQKATILAAIKAHAATKAYPEIAALLRLPLNTVIFIGHQAGFKKPYVFPAHRAHQARMRKFIQANAATHSMAQMGRMLGVTRERVRQLCNKWQIERPPNKNSKLHGMSDGQLRKLVRQPEKTLSAIGRELGVLRNVLAYELRRRGISPFTRHERNAKLFKRGLRVCFRCRRIKPLDRFSRNTARLTGHDFRCLECTKAISRERHARKASGRPRRRDPEPSTP